MSLVLRLKLGFDHTRGKTSGPMHKNKITSEEFL